MKLERPSLARGLSVAFALVWSGSNVSAGDIAGTVTEAGGGTFLPGAVVTVLGSGRSTTTDSTGAYLLPGVPAGTYQVQFRYLGYDSKVVPVTVPETGRVSLDGMLGDETVELEEYTVEGYREGRARALQQKQNQTNISDIIASDAIGNLPDRNVAEAVARLPGVSLSLEQGEGRYVSIRGVEPNLNQVLIDGAVAAAPGGTRLGRAVPLDTLAAGQVAQIEVVKSVTPDLDANSLGGTLKIKSSSPFDRKGRHVSGEIGGIHNDSTSSNNLQARLAYSNIFADGKWGLMVGGSYDERDYSNHWMQSSWGLRNINGADIHLPSGFEIKPEEGTQERWGGNLALEYRPSVDLQFYLRPSYSVKNRFEHTVEVLHSFDTNPSRVTLLSPTSATMSRVRTERRDFRSQRDQDLFNVAAGFKLATGDFVVEPMLTYSRANEDRVYDNILAFRNSNGATGPVTVDWTAFDFTSLDVNPTIDVPANYPLRRTREDGGLVEEDTFTAKVDVTWKLDGLLGDGGFLKTGIKYIERSRITNLFSHRLVPTSSWNLGAVGTLPSTGVYDNRYQTGFLLDHFATFQYIRSNPTLTQVDITESERNSIEDDYDIDEWIYAGYLMGSTTRDRLTILGGVRWEKTDATIRAVEARFEDGDFVDHTPTSGSTSYDMYLPNLQFVYRFTDRLLARAAITQTIGRPAYEDARPLSNFEYEPLGSGAQNPNFTYIGSLDIGNPDLSPYDSTNLDLSIEWYAGGASMISLAAFQKNIDDPIYEFSEDQRNIIYSGVALESLSVSTMRNADEGEIKGIELNVYLPFTFLPGVFSGFGVEANITKITSEVTVPTRPGEDFDFFRQPDEIYNVTLFYQRKEFSGRLAWNRTGGQLDTLGSSVLNDVYRRDRDQLDAHLRYRFTENLAVSASARNLTNEKEQFSYGVKSLMRTSRLLHADYKVGLEFNF